MYDAAQVQREIKMFKVQRCTNPDCSRECGVLDLQHVIPRSAVPHDMQFLIHVPELTCIVCRDCNLTVADTYDQREIYFDHNMREYGEGAVFAALDRLLEQVTIRECYLPDVYIERKNQ